MVESVLFLRKSRATTKAHRGIIFQFGVDPLNTILPINHGEIGKNQLAPLEQIILVFNQEAPLLGATMVMQSGEGTFGIEMEIAEPYEIG